MIKNNCDYLFLHGWGFNHHIFESFVKGIKQTNNVLTPCLYQLSREAGSSSFKAIANELKRRIENSTVVIGWSLGGLIATNLARISNRIEKLILISYAPRFVNTEKWKYVISDKDYKELKYDFVNDPEKTLNTFLGIVCFGDTPYKTSKKRLQGYIANTINKKILLSWLNEMAEEDQTELITMLNMPKLFLYGENDALINPEVTSQFQRHISSAQYEIIKNCGHAPFISCENETKKIVNRFFNDKIS